MDKVDAAKDIDNKNDEFSVFFEMEIIDECTFDKEVMVTDESRFIKKTLEDNIWGYWQGLLWKNRCAVSKRVTLNC